MSSHPRRLWMRRLAVAGLLVAATLLAACGQAAAVHRPLRPTPAIPTATPIPPTPAPTITPAPARPLQWQARTVPAPFTTENGNSGVALTLSPMNSALVWACAPQGKQARVWVSHDLARTWQAVSGMTYDYAITGCWITADDLRPDTAVLQAFISLGQCCDRGPFPMRITTDGGQTWAPLAGPEDTVRQIATFRGALYAIFARHFMDLAPLKSEFVISADGGQTWKSMDSKLATPNELPTLAGFVTQFWINPATGAMLAHTGAATVWMDHFLASGDGGATWRDLQAPQADDFLVRTPFAAGPWELCGFRQSNSSAHPSWNNTMPCTLDGGATWQTRTITPIRDAFAIANDGSVLGETGSRLERLTPSGGDWQTLGPLNEIWMPPTAYVAGSGAGVLWNVPAWSGPATGSTVYVASYP